METICTNIDYYIPDTKGATKSFTEDAMARLRKSSRIAFFIQCAQCQWMKRRAWELVRLTPSLVFPVVLFF